MIGHPDFARTLFIFNDNEAEFLAHLQSGRHTCTAGGGNATIRPFQCQPMPRAAGVPTGTYEPGPHYMGYSTLDAHVCGMVDLSIGQIANLLTSGRFDSLAFSWDPVTKLGGRLFDTAQEVRDYIVDRLCELATAN